MIRINLIGEGRKQFEVKVDDFLVHLDYVNHQLFYSYKESDKMYSMDYDGGLLKNASVIKNGALAFYGDSLYKQENETLAIQQKNASTGVVYRNISLPMPVFHLKELVIIEQSLYPTGKLKRLFLNYHQNVDMYICTHYHHHCLHNNHNDHRTTAIICFFFPYNYFVLIVVLLF